MRNPCFVNNVIKITFLEVPKIGENVFLRFYFMCRMVSREIQLTFYSFVLQLIAIHDSVEHGIVYQSRY